MRDEAREPQLQDDEQAMLGEDNSGAGESIGMIPHRRPQKTTNSQKLKLCPEFCKKNPPRYCPDFYKNEL